MSFPPGVESVGHSLLLATLHSLSTPHFLGPVITHTTASTRHRLTIILFSRFFNSYTHNSDSYATSSLGISHTERWDDVQRILTYVYVQAAKIAQEMGKILMEVDVLLKGFDEDLPVNLGGGMDAAFRVQGDAIAVPLPPSIQSLPQIYLPISPGTPDGEPTPVAHHDASSPPLPPLFPVVVIGGTFDHLHAGHKILLSMSAWIASEKLIVGITDDPLLKSKSNKHLLESISVRISRVRAFLELFKPTLVYDLVPIDDVYGPTGWDPNIQALVVSRETLSGATSIAKHREAHSLPPLETFIIDVISSNSSNIELEDFEMLKKTKMSSTFIRDWISRNSDEN